MKAHHQTMSPRRWGHAARSAALLAAIAAPAAAEPSLALLASETRLARLAPQAGSQQLQFTVDAKATRLTLDIGAVPAQLAASITAPGGQVITEATIGNLGGTYTRLEAVAEPAGPGVYAINANVTHQLFQFPSLGAGTYLVNVAAPALTGEAAVIAQLASDSPIAAGLMFTTDHGVVGRQAVLSAAVVDGAVALGGAGVTAHVLDANGAITDIVLLDNGTGADALAGDGLYSGFFTPAAVGRHDALADIVGSTPAAVPFRRQATAQLDVVAATAQFNGDIADLPRDDDGDGRIEQIVLTAGVSVTEAGNYHATAYLRTPGNQAFEAAAAQQLSSGQAQVSVAVPASAFVQRRENGPYVLERMVLQKVEDGSATPADTLAGPRATAAYRLEQFERAPIALTGTSNDVGTDTNGNGLFDRLTVSLEVELEFAGTYQYTGRLSDKNGAPIEYVSGSVNSPGGRGPFAFDFDGRKIGLHGVSGPYSLDNVLIYGPGRSLSVLRTAATTRAYDVRQFEAGARNPADVNGDGQVDCADIALVKAGFGRRAGQPGADPRTDVNADQVTDVRDLAIVSRALAVGTRCP